MSFKEWLDNDLNEVRYKGYWRMFQQQHPNMDKYVGKEIYNNRVGSGLNMILNPQKQTPLRQRQINTAFNGMVQDPRNAPGKIMQGAGFLNTLWGAPQVLRGRDGLTGVTPNDFTPHTVGLFIDRRFGSRKEAEIRNDGGRTDLQRSTAQNMPAQDGKAVLVRATTQGYDLLEGWHRVMSYFYHSMTPQMRRVNDNLDLANNEVAEYLLPAWRVRVPIRAYLAVEPENLGPSLHQTSSVSNVAATGAYSPADLAATGKYIPAA